MKSAKFSNIVSIALAATGVAVCQAQMVEPNGTYAPGGTAQSQPTQADSLTQAIVRAPDPSSAIQAYGLAKAALPGDIRIEQAYVHQMVSFGLPEMADQQALAVVQQVPTDGQAWAVAAYMSAKRDQTAQGLAEISQAVKYSPQDAFVQRTAGQLLAWYDTRVDKSQVPANAQAGAEGVRTGMASQGVYADAYTRATDMYKAMATSSGVQATQPGAGPPQMDMAQTAPYTPGAGGVVGQPLVTGAAPYPYDGSNPYLVPPAYAYGYAGAPYWYPYTYWGPGYWWPSFGAAIVISSGFHNHDDHHDHGDGHGDGHGFVGSGLTAGHWAWSDGMAGQSLHGTGMAGMPRVSSAGMPQNLQSRFVAPSAGVRTWSAPRSFAPVGVRAPMMAAPRFIGPGFSHAGGFGGGSHPGGAFMQGGGGGMSSGMMGHGGFGGGHR